MSQFHQICEVHHSLSIFTKQPQIADLIAHGAPKVRLLSGLLPLAIANERAATPFSPFTGGVRPRYSQAMAEPRVYVETTIPSFYHETRRAAEIVARRRWTRRWWREAQSRYHLVTSAAVLDELMGGDAARSAKRLALVQGLPLLEIEPAIGKIVQTYIRHRLMPVDPTGDALHLALASYHKCDFLVTWNCRHLANANKFTHFRTINARLGLFTPALVTPLELLGEET